MRNTSLLLRCLLCALIVALTGCGGGNNGFSGNSSTGIAGTAQLTTQGGPAIPGGTSGATSLLQNAVITVQPAGGGAEIIRVLSGPTGEFRIPLLPGSYRVVPLVSAADQRKGTTARSQDVTVLAGGYTSIVVQYTLSLP